MTRVAIVRDLRQHVKAAFLPVPAHPDHAPQAPAGAPPAGAPPAAAPPAAPPTDPAAAGMAPPAAPAPPPPGPPPVNPDIIAVLQEATGKIEAFGKSLAEIQQQQVEIKNEMAHDKAMRQARKDTVNAVMDSGL